MYQPYMNDIWIEENFGGANFNDERLSNRLILIANGMSKLPEGSIPQQMVKWKDIKTCYEFFKNDKVTHKRIQTPHRERVKKASSERKNGKVVLFPQDTSELDYTNLEKIRGHIGNHQNTGLMFHHSLAIEPDTINPKVLGLAHQQVRERKNPSLNKNESRTERNKRSKESDLWLKNLKAIGSPPEECIWVSVGDRANDVFEFFVKSKELGWESVVRACQDRNIDVDGYETLLMRHMRSLESMGTTIIDIRKEGGSKQEEMVLNVSWEQITLQVPARLKGKLQPLSLTAIRCWNEEEGIEWILYSSILVNSTEEAIEKIRWYSNRWIIEEYHKCLKTGCRIESSQLEAERRIEALVGILGVIAILMLQLRNIARAQPEIPAKEVVDEDALEIICKRFQLPKEINVRIFWHSVAKLGGFIGRRSDGEPGWQTLWKGWLRFLDIFWGYTISRLDENDNFY